MRYGPLLRLDAKLSPIIFVRRVERIRLRWWNGFTSTDHPFILPLACSILPSIVVNSGFHNGAYYGRYYHRKLIPVPHHITTAYKLTNEAAYFTAMG